MPDQYPPSVYQDPRRYAVTHDQAELEKPIEEAVAGPVIPYRGQQSHGVPFQIKPQIPELDRWTQEPVDIVQPDRDEHPPVAVKIVNQGGLEVRRFRTFQHVIQAGGSLDAISRMPSRNKLIIRNCNTAATDKLWCGDTQNVNALMGHLIPAGGFETFETTEPVYLFADVASAAPIQVSFLVFYSSPVDYREAD